jgi:vesicle-associated membrane protein 7
MILYGLVARGKNVLAEFTTTSGNFPTITRVLLGKIPDQDGKMSYVYDSFVFHYVVENHIIYLCMCDDMNKRRIPFLFLDDVKQRFLAAYGEAAQTAHAFAMSAEFGRTLEKQMEFYNSSSADSFAQVNSKLDDVKNVMVQNIEMVLERGERLELLVDKTDKLQAEAFKFNRGARALKNQMIWRQIKLYALGIFIVAFIIFVITWIGSSLSLSFFFPPLLNQTHAHPLPPFISL